MKKQKHEHKHKPEHNPEHKPEPQPIVVDSSPAPSQGSLISIVVFIALVAFSIGFIWGSRPKDVPIDPHSTVDIHSFVDVHSATNIHSTVNVVPSVDIHSAVPVHAKVDIHTDVDVKAVVVTPPVVNPDTRWNDVDLLRDRIRELKRDAWNKKVEDWKKRGQTGGNRGFVLKNGTWQTVQGHYIDQSHKSSFSIREFRSN